MKSSLNFNFMSISIMFSIVILFGFLCSLASSQQQTTSDSCSTNNLMSTNVTNLIPFNTSLLNCFSAWSSQGFVLRYEKSGRDLWSFVLSAPDTSSYVAIGFSSDGKMVGSSAIAGWITSSGMGIAKQYSLGGTDSSDCPPDQGYLKLVKGKTVIISQSSRLYLAFQLNTSQPQRYLIYAVGPRNRLPSSDSYLSEHRTKASASVNYVTGVATDAGNGSGISSERKHAILVILGWGVLVPIGIMFARYFKHWDPQWFYSHISIQGIGFLLGLAGIITGFSLDDEGEGDVDSHKVLGICILVFGCLQVVAILARPGKSSKVRKYWNWYHWYVGRTAVACGIGNIFFGLSIAHESSSWSIGYGIFLAIWAVACLVLEVIMWINGDS